MDIVIHVGYPKTATTFMQREIFRELKALGNDSVVPGARQVENRLRDAVCCKPPGIWYSAEGQSIIQAIRDLSAGASSVLYSSEFWLRGPARFYPEKIRPLNPTRLTHLCVEHLVAFQENWGERHGSVRVMVTIRNQASWLGSRYAQVSNRRKKPGQSDFFEIVMEMLNDPSPQGWNFLNYHLLLNSLEAALGKDRVLMLPYEEVNEPLFWSVFANWSGLPVTKKSICATGVNARRLEGMRWKTRPRSVLSDCWPVLMIDQLLGSCGMAPRLKHKIKRIEKRFYGEGVIALDAQMTERIRETYQASNIALETAIGCDLRKHGYYL